MTRNNTGNRRAMGFTLLEVVVALAILALIAIPAVGLATMAVSRGHQQMTIGDASQLKAKVDIALRSQGTDAIFGQDYLSGGLEFLASESLQYIELASGGADQNNDSFYKITVLDPVGYQYTEGADPYRIVLYEVNWPNNEPNAEQKQAFFTSVFRK